VTGGFPGGDPSELQGDRPRDDAGEAAAAPMPERPRRAPNDDVGATPVALVAPTAGGGAGASPRPQPLVPPAPQTPRPLRAPHQSEAAARRSGSNAVRVLVVDDEPTICKALTIALIREGYEVLAANGGEAAHAVLAEQRVDVMIVDLRMPDLRGDVVYHLASALQPWLSTRTVFTTGDISARAEEIVHACGCHLLRKPFTLAEALDAVSAVAPKEGASRTA
jgi:CheY-like chemotaxis protein